MRKIERNFAHLRNVANHCAAVFLRGIINVKRVCIFCKNVCGISRNVKSYIIRGCIQRPSAACGGSIIAAVVITDRKFPTLVGFKFQSGFLSAARRRFQQVHNGNFVAALIRHILAAFIALAVFVFVNVFGTFGGRSRRFAFAHFILYGIEREINFAGARKIYAYGKLSAVCGILFRFAARRICKSRGFIAAFPRCGKRQFRFRFVHFPFTRKPRRISFASVRTHSYVKHVSVKSVLFLLFGFGNVFKRHIRLSYDHPERLRARLINYAVTGFRRFFRTAGT